MEIKIDMVEVDIIILDLNGGDLAIHFVMPEFYNEFTWSPEEVEAFDSAESNGDKWKVAHSRRERIGEISFEDSRVLKTVYTQAWTDGEAIDEEYKIGRVMNLEC